MVRTFSSARHVLKLMMMTNMERGAAFLHAHVVALAEDFAIGADEASTNRNATLVGALVCLVKGNFEPNV